MIFGLFLIFMAFSIYVGEKSSLNDLITSNKKIAIKNNAKIENLDNPLLYRIINNKIIILRELNSNDIVVQNKEELQQVLKNLSLEFQNIKDTIQRIRKLN